MDNYHPVDLTQRAKEIAAAHAASTSSPPAAAPAQPPPETSHRPPQCEIPGYGSVAQRVLASVYPDHSPDGVKIAARSLTVISYGTQDIQLSAVEQLVDRSQTRAVADAVKWLHARVGGGQRKTLSQLLRELDAALDQQVRYDY
jgi:hypothetical protein